MAFVTLNNNMNLVGGQPSNFNTSSNFGSSSANTWSNVNLNNGLPGGGGAPQMNEVFLGQILSQIIVRAILSFDDPVTTQGQGQGGSSRSPQQNQQQPQQPQQSQQQQQNVPSSQRNQVAGSGALTKEGGLSYGGGVRVGGGAPWGFSAVGSTTINNAEGYQTSGGISAAGLSANAGVQLNSGGLSFSGGIQRAQVGQGIVGSTVGPRLVGP